MSAGLLNYKYYNLTGILHIHVYLNGVQVLITQDTAVAYFLI